MFQNLAVERPRNHSAGRERPSAGHLFWEARKLRDVLFSFLHCLVYLLLPGL